MKRLVFSIFLVGSLFIFFTGLVKADVIADWNERAGVAGEGALGNFPTARAIAMVHLAMFEAVNSIEPRYTHYRARLSASRRRVTPLRLAPPMPYWCACFPNKPRN